MAEILVRAIDARHADLRKQQRGCFARGDVVVVKQDGHQWGAREGLPMFWVVKVAGVPVDDLQYVVASTPHRRRRFALDFTAHHRAALDATGEIALTRVELDARLSDRGEK